MKKHEFLQLLDETVTTYCEINDMDPKEVDWDLCFEIVSQTYNLHGRVAAWYADRWCRKNGD